LIEAISVTSSRMATETVPSSRLVGQSCSMSRILRCRRR
jgi:hypothetical protein